jgi:hypothetical protein
LKTKQKAALPAAFCFCVLLIFNLFSWRDSDEESKKRDRGDDNSGNDEDQERAGDALPVFRGLVLRLEVALDADRALRGS